MTRYLSLIAFLSLVAASPAFAVQTADVTVGHYYLQPNTPNQTIPIYVSGGAAISGVDFNLQIGDGGIAAGGTAGPVFSNVDFQNGTIFQMDYSDPIDTGSIPQLLTYAELTNTGYVSANGLLATVTVDTTGFTQVGETWPLSIFNTRNGATDFVGASSIPSSLIDGQITLVPEPSSLALLALGSLGLLWFRGRRSAIRGQQVALKGPRPLTSDL